MQKALLNENQAPGGLFNLKMEIDLENPLQVPPEVMDIPDDDTEVNAVRSVVNPENTKVNLG